MKKVIKGAVYNTETAKKLCEQQTYESSYGKGAYVNQLKQLYKTKSGKYFFFIKSRFSAYVDVKNDDLNPKFELTDVEENKIIPIAYEVAVQFANEIASDDPELQRTLSKYFPTLTSTKTENEKIQKKIYLSEKANWYLEMMIDEAKETNSSFIENLILEAYRDLYKKGIMKGDPYVEMDGD